MYEEDSFEVEGLTVIVLYDHLHEDWEFLIFSGEEGLGGSYGYATEGEAREEGELQARRDWLPIIEAREK